MFPPGCFPTVHKNSFRNARAQQNRNGIWKVGFRGEGPENRSTRGKTSRSRAENQNKLNTHITPGPGSAVYKDHHATYSELLERVQLPLKNRRLQDVCTLMSSINYVCNISNIFNTGSTFYSFRDKLISVSVSV